jgi:plasmid stabilization system protein ParE
MSRALRVRFQARAAEEVAEIDTWWRSHRDAADLFAVELSGMIGVLVDAPGLGASAVDPRLGQVRRVLLRKTRYHVYFRVMADSLEVLAVWHANRQPPKL